MNMKRMRVRDKIVCSDGLIIQILVSFDADL